MKTQVVPVGVRGLSQKDPRSGGKPGDLSIAENVIFNKGADGVLLAEKRKGIRNSSTVTLSGAQIDHSYDIFSDNGTLYQLAEDGVYGYVPTPDLWTKIGEQQPSFLSAEVRGAGPNYVQCTDQATASGGGRLVCWEQIPDGVSAAGVYATLYAENGSVIWENQSVAADGRRPKAVATQKSGADTFIVAWIVDSVPGTAGELWLIEVDAATGAVGPALLVSATIASLETAGPGVPHGWFDMAARANGDILFAWNDNVTLGGGQVYTDVFQIATGGMTAQINTGWSGEIAGCLAAVDQYDGVSTTYIDIGTVKTDGGHVIRISGVTRAPVGHVKPIAAGTGSNVAGCYVGATGETWLAYEVQDPTGSNKVTKCAVYWGKVTQAFVPSGGLCKRSVGLASKAATWNSKPLAMVCFCEPYPHPTTFADAAGVVQSTFFLLDIATGNLVSKVLVDQAGGIESMSVSDQDILPHSSTLPALQEVGTSLVCCTKRIAASAISRSIAVQYRQPALLTWTNAPTSRPLVLDGETYVLGGMPQVFDGNNLLSPFLNRPPKPEVEVVAAAGPLVDGTYGWIAVYAVSDARGQVYRSAPSQIGSGVFTPGNHGANVTVEYYRLTSGLSGSAAPDVGNFTRAWVEIYRNSQDDLETFRLVSTVDPYIVNDPSADTFVYAETCSDGAQAGGIPLYTTGNFELAHGQPPPARAGCVWQNHVVLCSLDDPGTLAFSLDKIAGQGIQFSQFLTYRLPGNPGLPTAVNVMDEKVIVHCASAIFVVTGQIPNNSGAGGTLNAAQIPTQFGALGPALVEVVPMGTLRWTANGPYLLARDLSDNFFGYATADFAGANAVCVINGANEPRTFIFTSDSDCLVFDHVFGVWSTFTRHGAYRACTYLGRLIWLPSTTDGSFRARSDDYVDVNGAYISMRLRFADIHWGFVEGYVAVYQGIFLGEYVDEHKLRGRVFYDYRSPSAYVQEFERNIGPDFPESYATASLYASLTPYAGSGDGVYQYPWFFRFPFCSAIALEIWDEQADGSAVVGGGFRLSNIVFEVGVEGRPNRIAPGKRLVR